MVKLTVRKIGNSLGVILPQETLSDLNVKEGDTLSATATPEGVRLTAFDPEFAAQLEVAKTVMRENRDVLRELAK
jgi:putative addiction module antidote